MGFSKEEIQAFDMKALPESQLDDLEKGLVGNFGVIETYRYRACDSYTITDILHIYFNDGSQVKIYAE